MARHAIDLGAFQRMFLMAERVADLHSADGIRQMAVPAATHLDLAVRRLVPLLPNWESACWLPPRDLDRGTRRSQLLVTAAVHFLLGAGMAGHAERRVVVDVAVGAAPRRHHQGDAASTMNPCVGASQRAREPLFRA